MRDRDDGLPVCLPVRLEGHWSHGVAALTRALPIILISII
jgi:hypothetical protein